MPASKLHSSPKLNHNSNTNPSCNPTNPTDPTDPTKPYHLMVRSKYMPPNLRLCWKHVLGGVHTGAIWRIILHLQRAAAMRPFCQITFTTCYL